MRTKPETKVITIKYFSDPQCSATYTSESSRDKILDEYSGMVRFVYKMWPLYDSLKEHLAAGTDGLMSVDDLARHWKEISDETDVYIDHRLWFEDPPQTCRLACEAFKAAELQGQQFAAPFLRMLREGYMRRRMNLGKKEKILELAKEASEKLGLDYKRFKRDLESESAKNAVVADEKEAEKFGVKVSPTLVFDDKIVVAGPVPYSRYQKAITSLLRDRGSKPNNKPVRNPL